MVAILPGHVLKCSPSSPFTPPPSHRNKNRSMSDIYETTQSSDLSMFMKLSQNHENYNKLN